MFKKLKYHKVFGYYLQSLGVMLAVTQWIYSNSVEDIFKEADLGWELIGRRGVVILVGLIYVGLGLALWYKPNWEAQLVQFRVSAISEIMLWIGTAIPAFLSLYYLTQLSIPLT